MWIYRGYLSNSVDEVVAAYTRKTGFAPTVLVVRTDHELIGEHPCIIHSDKYGVHAMVLATHLLLPDEIEQLRNDEPITFQQVKEEKERNLSHADLATQSPIINKAKAGRPKVGGNKCPHCQQEIKNFNTLGWWYGWNQGIEPPYWEDLRLYVFRRDEFHCQTCHRMFGMSGLTAHHIIPKETGGSDSARNLVTLCHDCHPDTKPIMAE